MPAFAIRDCTVTALATGEDARNLRELRDRIRTIPDGSLYYHFWGRRLRPVFEEREYNNDFADWAAHGLRDLALAERLALLDPVDFPDFPSLRNELLDRVEERLSERPDVPWSTADDAFHFISGQIVVFDTPHRVEGPRELGRLVPDLSPSSVYYHFVDARHRSPDGIDDFQAWLRTFGEPYDELCERLSRIDVSFTSLDRLQARLSILLLEYAEEEGL